MKRTGTKLQKDCANKEYIQPFFTDGIEIHKWGIESSTVDGGISRTITFNLKDKTSKTKEIKIEYNEPISRKIDQATEDLKREEEQKRQQERQQMEQERQQMEQRLHAARKQMEQRLQAARKSPEAQNKLTINREDIINPGLEIPEEGNLKYIENIDKYLDELLDELGLKITEEGKSTYIIKNINNSKLEKKGLVYNKRYILNSNSKDLIYEELRKDNNDTEKAFYMASMSNLQIIKHKIIQKILDDGIVVESVAGGKKKYKRSKKKRIHSINKQKTNIKKSKSRRINKNKRRQTRRR